MCKVLEFPKHRIKQAVPIDRVQSESAEILFFEGVRYSRLSVSEAASSQDQDKALVKAGLVSE